MTEQTESEKVVGELKGELEMLPKCCDKMKSHIDETSDKNLCDAYTVGLQFLERRGRTVEGQLRTAEFIAAAVAPPLREEETSEI